MAQQPHELPVLPVLVPLAVAAFVLVLWALHRRAGLTLWRAVVAAVACGYGAGIVAHTVFPIVLDAREYDVPWRVYLHLTPLAGTDPADMVRNVVVFVPLGLLVPLVGRTDSWLGALLVGFGVSLLMETVQLVNAVTGHGGHVADVNDLLANTLGALVGFVLVRGVERLPLGRRILAASRWPATRR